MSSVDKLRDLINVTNDPERPLDSINVTFGTVAASDNANFNSMIEVEGEPGHGYYGSVDIYFNRLLLSDVIGAEHVRSTATLTKASILQLVNNLFNLFLTVDDINDFTVPTLTDGQTATVTLSAVAGSIGFTGQADITVEYGKSWLDSIVSVRILPTLTHPCSLVGKQSSRMVTWNRDFTSVRDALVVTKATSTTPANQYTDWPTVQDACTAYGIPSWTQASITDNATSDIPDANPAFNRVVIQSAVASDQLIGPIYLHYNVLEGV